MAPAARVPMTREQVPVAEPVFFPGGVADPAGRAGYVADGAGIAAVVLSDGRALWRTEHARRPLFSDGERLAAAAVEERRSNVLRVVVLDAARGTRILVSDPIVLPDWVAPPTERREPVRMRVQAAGSRLELEWEAHGGYRGGAAPPSHIRRAAARDAAGVVEVDLESGAVAPRPVAGEAAPAIRRPPLHADDLAEPWLVGATVARLVWDGDESEPTVALETSDARTGRPSAIVTLARGRGLVAEVTSDGHHLLIHEEPAPAGSDAWRVFCVRTGRRVATLRHDPGARCPAILGDRLFYLVEAVGDSTVARALRAREIASGTLAWELPLTPRRRSAPPRLRQ